MTHQYRNGPRAAGERVDRRVRRTKELLRRALIALILEKGYERVSVSDIIGRADVGRSTFYAHFRDKEDLLVYGLEELRAAFAPVTDPDPDSPAEPAGSPTLAVFSHMERSREIWKAMAGRRGADMFLRYLREFLTELLTEQLRRRAPAGPTVVPLTAVVEAAVSVLIGLGVHWWISGERDYTAREMDEVYRRLTEPAIQAGLRPRGGSRPGPT